MSPWAGVRFGISYTQEVAGRRKEVVAPMNSNNSVRVDGVCVVYSVYVTSINALRCESNRFGLCFFVGAATADPLRATVGDRHVEWQHKWQSEIEWN